MQTTKYTKVRAKQDPDYVARKHSGVFYGLNVAKAAQFEYNPHTIIAHTRGSVVK